MHVFKCKSIHVLESNIVSRSAPAIKRVARDSERADQQEGDEAAQPKQPRTAGVPLDDANVGFRPWRSSITESGTTALSGCSRRSNVRDFTSNQQLWHNLPS